MKGYITEDISNDEQACVVLTRIIHMASDLLYELQMPGCEKEYEMVLKLKKRAIAEKKTRGREDEAV